MHKFYKRTLVSTILRFQPIINKTIWLVSVWTLMNFSDLAQIIHMQYDINIKKFLIDSIAKLRLFNCIILFGDHHKSSNNNSFKTWLSKLGPPNPLFFIISSARKRQRELILKSLFKKLGQLHPHCRGVAPTEISGPSEQKSRCYLA